VALVEEEPPTLSIADTPIEYMPAELSDIEQELSDVPHPELTEEPTGRFQA